MEYPKIQSLYKREGYDFEKTGIKTKQGKLLLGEYSLPEFSLIKQWQVFEKIDGTNVRAIYKNNLEETSVIFHGRTNNSQMPPFLLKYLQETFTLEKLEKVFKGADRVIIFGEGYGPKIQSGGVYRKDVSFIGFDIFANGWWLKMEDCKEIFENLGVKMVPHLGTWTRREIEDYVRSQPKSVVAENPDYVMEGVVCRTNPMLCLRNGEMLKFKLRCEDMKDLY